MHCHLVRIASGSNADDEEVGYFESATAHRAGTAVRPPSA